MTSKEELLNGLPSSAHARETHPSGDSGIVIQISYTNMSKKQIPSTSEFIHAHLRSEDLGGCILIHCLNGRGGKKLCKRTFLVRLNLLHKWIGQNCCKSLSAANSRK